MYENTRQRQESYYVIVTLITGTSTTAMSALDGIVMISCVLSNTSFKMTTYPLSRSTPVDMQCTTGKEIKISDH